MHRLTAVGTVVFLFCLTGFAHAQMNPFGQSGPQLHDGDFAELRDAAYSLYRDTDPVENASASWENTRSGSAGTVRIVDVSRGENLCVKLRHSFKLGGQADQHQFDIERCLVGNQWQLMQ